MDRLEFRVRGLASDQARRWRRVIRPAGVRPFGGQGRGLFKGAALGAGGVLWPLALLLAYGLFSPLTVKIGGMRVQATEVLALVDDSSSMNAYVARKDEALGSFRSAGVSTGDEVGIQGSANDLLGTITAELAKRPGVDAIWLLSDFHDGSDLVRGDDRRHYEELRRLLGQRRIRLYLSTVAVTPPEDHIRAALGSGGDLHSFQ